MPLYPMFLKLDAEPCLVVGAGDIGAQKAEGLLAAGAALTVVSPLIGPRMEKAIASAAIPVVVEKRTFVPEDCEGMRMVISATGDPKVDAVVYDVARNAHALVNIVDVKEQCDFYAGSIVQQGPLAILIGTEGKAPAVARYTRKLLERELPPALGALADALGERRPQLLSAVPDFAARGQLLGAFVDRAAPRLRPHIDQREITAWIDAEVLAPTRATAGVDVDAPYLLDLTLNLDAPDDQAIHNIQIASRHFAVGTVDVDVLSEGDAAYIADQVRSILRRHNALEHAAVVTVRAHGIDVHRGDTHEVVVDDGHQQRREIVDLVSPLCTLD